MWTPAYGQSKAGRPARIYIQQLCDDTGCNPEDLPEAMNDRETWRERERGSGISVLAVPHDDDDDDDSTQWLVCSPFARRPGFNPRLSHTKDFKNGT